MNHRQNTQAKIFEKFKQFFTMQSCKQYNNVISVICDMLAAVYLHVLRRSRPRAM